jgi:ferritin-like metal-binding protein YciE
VQARQARHSTVRAITSDTEGRHGTVWKDIKTMDDLLLHGLKDIYYAENQIIKSLPKLIEKASNEEKAADKKLSTVALRKGVNRKAAS